MDTKTKMSFDVFNKILALQMKDYHFENAWSPTFLIGLNFKMTFKICSNYFCTYGLKD
jgi:hypothetical protein